MTALATRAGLFWAAAALLGLAGFGCSNGDDDTITFVEDMQMRMPDAGPDLGGPDGGSDEVDGGSRNHASVSIGPGGANRFGPRTVFIAAGGSVTWTWVTGVHGIVSDDLPAAFDPSPTQAAGRFTVTFATPGQFGYHCAVHGTMMTGVVVVE